MDFDLQNDVLFIVELSPSKDNPDNKCLKRTIVGEAVNISVAFKKLFDVEPDMVPIVETALRLHKEDQQLKNGRV